MTKTVRNPQSYMGFRKDIMNRITYPLALILLLVGGASACADKNAWHA